MINHIFSNSYLILSANINDIIITFRTRQPPAEKNKYATGIYHRQRSRADHRPGNNTDRKGIGTSIYTRIRQKQFQRVTTCTAIIRCTLKGLTFYEAQCMWYFAATTSWKSTFTTVSWSQKKSSKTKRTTWSRFSVTRLYTCSFESLCTVAACCSISALGLDQRSCSGYMTLREFESRSHGTILVFNQPPHRVTQPSITPALARTPHVSVVVLVSKCSGGEFKHYFWYWQCGCRRCACGI